MEHTSSELEPPSQTLLPDECDVVTAKVVALGDDGITTQLDNGTEVFVPKDELDVEATVGQTLEVFLERAPDGRASLRGSTIKAGKLRLWHHLDALPESDQTIEGEVVAVVNGGLAVDIGVRGFVPQSQVELRHADDLGSFVGQRLAFHVLKFNRKRGNVVLTRRKVLQEERRARRDETVARIREGEVLTGVVCNFTRFGAFVDVGGIDGLIHTNDLSWGRVHDPREVLQLGQEVRVKVLEFDEAKDRLSLGYKQLLPDPWGSVEQAFPVGARVTGRVVSTTEYGAFVEVAPGIEGLVHISEMTWAGRPQHARELVERGQEVEAEVLAIDLGQRRLALGMKQIQPNPWEAFKETHPVGSRVRGTVRRIKDFGAFIELDNGLEGLLHIKDLTWEGKTKDPSEVVEVGQELELVVLEVTPSRSRIGLGLKQLSDDPWKVAAGQFPVGTKVSGRVTRIEPYGAFIEVAPGIEGLCHISQLSVDRVESVSEVTKIGATLETAVVGFDPHKRKVSLSVRALTEAGDDYRKYLVDEGQDGFGKVLGQKLADALATPADD